MTVEERKKRAESRIRAWFSWKAYKRDLERVCRVSLWDEIRSRAFEKWDENLKRERDSEARKLWPATVEINPLEHEGMK